MNGTPQRIEIFEPFSAAFRLMKKILFQPFDPLKWLIIGFAAFLSHLAGGSSTFSPGFPSSSWRSHAGNVATSVPHIGLPLLAFFIFLGLLAVVIGIACLWVGSRGRFIFLDCIVRDRAAIQEPWNEYAREGNSFFFFALAVAALFVGLTLIGVLPLVLLGSHANGAAPGVAFGCAIALVVFIVVVLAVLVAVVMHFMVPVMYRRRCTAMEAFRITTHLMREHFGSFLLYFLFLLAVKILIGLVLGLLACVTCFIVALILMIPYLASVLLLPVDIVFNAYPLLFLRQFGTDFDVWGGTMPVPAAVLPIAVPPPPPIPPTQPPAPPSPPL
jgi:hypothetical protein